jgi:hypothetical protein
MSSKRAEAAFNPLRNPHLRWDHQALVARDNTRADLNVRYVKSET